MLTRKVFQLLPEIKQICGTTKMKERQSIQYFERGFSGSFQIDFICLYKD